MVADLLRAKLGRESPRGISGNGNWGQNWELWEMGSESILRNWRNWGGIGVRVDFVRSFNPIAAITFHETYRSRFSVPVSNPQAALSGLDKRSTGSRF